MLIIHGMMGTGAKGSVAAHGMPSLAQNHQKLKEIRKDPLLKPSESKEAPTGTLSLDFWSPEL